MTKLPRILADQHQEGDVYWTVNIDKPCHLDSALRVLQYSSDQIAYIGIRNRERNLGKTHASIVGAVTAKIIQADDIGESSEYVY